MVLLLTQYTEDLASELLLSPILEVAKSSTLKVILLPLNSDFYQ